MRHLSLLSVPFILLGCSSTVVHVPRVAPAEINIASYKRLAIGGIGGEGGDKLVDDLTQALVDTRVFEVLDRKHLAEVTKEQDFAISGRVSDDTAVSIGQMIGSAALLVGDISGYDYEESVDSTKKQCGPKGKQKPCTEFTRRGRAKLSVTFKVLDTESGKVLAAKNLDAAVQTAVQAMDKEPPALDKKDEWFASCRKQVVSDFVKVIAPYTTTVGVELWDDGDLPELEVGNNFAKLGNWASALEQYHAALARADKDPDIDMEVKAKALYDIGIGLGYSGQYDEGIAELEKAYAMSPEDAIVGQIARIKQFKADDEKLAEQRAAQSAAE